MKTFASVLLLIGLVTVISLAQSSVPDPKQEADGQASGQLAIQDTAQLVGKKINVKRLPLCELGTYRGDLEHAGMEAVVLSAVASKLPSLQKSALDRMSPGMRDLYLDQQKAALLLLQFEDGAKRDTCAAVGPKQLAQYIELAPGETLGPAASPAVTPAPSTDQPVQAIEPFGFKMGMTRDQVIATVGAKAVIKDEGDALTLSTAPKPYADLYAYMVLLSAKSGLAKVTASSKPMQVNSFGTELQEKFRTYEEAVRGKYGKPTNTFDFLKAGGIWDQPQEWMMGLLKNERTLTDVWDVKQPADCLIGLEAQALSPDVGFVALSYEFPNFSSWRQEHDQKANAVF